MSDDVRYLYEPEGSELHWDGLKPTMPNMQSSVGPASLSGPVRNPASRAGLAGTMPASAGTYANSGQAVGRPQAQATRAKTPQELLEQAESMLKAQQEQHAASLGAGPSVGVRDDSGGQVPSWLTKFMGSVDKEDTDI